MSPVLQNKESKIHQTAPPFSAQSKQASSKGLWGDCLARGGLLSIASLFVLSYSESYTGSSAGLCAVRGTTL